MDGLSEFQCSTSPIKLFKYIVKNQLVLAQAHDNFASVWLSHDLALYQNITLPIKVEHFIYVNDRYKNGMQ